MENPSGDLKDPWKMHHALDETFVRFTEVFLNAHPGRVANPEQYASDSRRFISLRNSVLYRFEALAFHVDLIRQRQAACMKELEKDMFRNDRLEIVRWASRDM